MDTPPPILLLRSTCKTDDTDNNGAGVDEVSSCSETDGSSFRSFVHDGGGEMQNPPPRSISSSHPNDPLDDNVQYALADLPITCDIMLMPEHHDFSNPNDSSGIPSPPLHVLHVPRTTINPCGISNVLVLENLPWRLGINEKHNSMHQRRTKSTVPDSQDQPTSMLMSLTSCCVSFETPPLPSESTSSSMKPRHYQLPVDPIPSTFVLTFESHDNGNPSSNAVVGESSVEFDFTEASRQAHELRMIYSSKSHAQEKAADMSLHSRSERQDNETVSEQINDSMQMSASRNINNASFTPNHSSLHHSESNTSLNNSQDDPATQCQFQPSPAPPPFDTLNSFHQNSPTKKDIDARRLLLIDHLQSRLEQEAQFLDRTLHGLAFMGLILTGVLLWAIYQYQQSCAKSDLQVQEIRESMQQTRSVLQGAVELLNQKPLHTNEEIGSDRDEFGHVRPFFSPSTPPTRASQLATTIVSPTSHGSINILNREDPCHDESRSCLGASSSSLPDLTSASVHAGLKLQKERLTFLGHTPSRRRRMDDQYLTSLLRSAARPQTVTLSPCSAFAKEWYERRTIRRSNRKKRRSFVQPISSQVSGQYGGNRSIDSQKLGNMAGSSQSSSSLSAESNDQDKILEPPNLRPVIRMDRPTLIYNRQIDDDATGDRLVQYAPADPSANAVTLSVGGYEKIPVGPPSTTSITSHDMSSPHWPPLLCSTPASEDGSFVDDYW